MSEKFRETSLLIFWTYKTLQCPCIWVSLSGLNFFRGQLDFFKTSFMQGAVWNKLDASLWTIEHTLNFSEYFKVHRTQTPTGHVCWQATIITTTSYNSSQNITLDSSPVYCVRKLKMSQEELLFSFEVKLALKMNSFYSIIFRVLNLCDQSYWKDPPGEQLLYINASRIGRTTRRKSDKFVCFRYMVFSREFSFSSFHKSCTHKHVDWTTL